MVTALDLITDSFLDLGVLADGETPSSSQAQGALRKLNQMIDGWNIEGPMVFGAAPYILPMVSGQASYTIGPGGNLNIPRPTNITAVFARDTTQPTVNQYDYPLAMFTNEQYADIPFKNMAATYPFYGVWFNETYPLITAYVNPVPTSNQYSLVFWADGMLGNLNLNDSITLPPGYQRALTANLCVELAGSYGATVPETVMYIARTSKNELKMKNFQLNEVNLNIGTGYYDIRTNRTW